MAGTGAQGAPLTGVQSPDDVLRFVAVHGPARNEAERAELLGALPPAGPQDEPPAAHEHGKASK